MKRRQLFRNTAALAAGCASAGTGILLASNYSYARTKPGTPLVPGNIIYTQENPGRWKSKVAGHLPIIKKEAAKNGEVKIVVTTPHEMDEFEHYIVKHILLDNNFEFLTERFFDPRVDHAAISEHLIPLKAGTIHALSVCNKHDTWMSSYIV